MIIFCHLSLSPYSLFIHLLISLFGFISSFWGPRRIVVIGRVGIVVAAIVVAVVVVTYLPSLSTPLISPLIVGIGMVGIVVAVIVAVVVVVTYLPWLSTPSISPLILDILLLITIVITVLKTNSSCCYITTLAITIISLPTLFTSLFTQFLASSCFVLLKG